MLKNKDELLGVYEVRELLKNKKGQKVSNQYINQLVLLEKLKPIADLRCGKIFLKSEVERFKNLQGK